MKTEEVIRRAKRLSAPYRVTDGGSFRLRDIDPGGLLYFKEDGRERAAEALSFGVRALAELQELLYAQDEWAVLLIFQAMDAAGKDGAIQHVMSGVNPTGCQVYSFKAPSSEDLDHDYLWRSMKCLPERGRIGIFNRSYYEETLVVRVHPELLKRQKLPRVLADDEPWQGRFKDIRNFERYLTRNGTVIRKFYLHMSKEEQTRRLLERLDDPDLTWKFSPNDLSEREYWDAYMNAFEETIRRTATPHAPWYVVPADHKWFTRVVVAAAVVEALASLNLAFPKVSEQTLESFENARQILTRTDVREAREKDLVVPG